MIKLPKKKIIFGYFFLLICYCPIMATQETVLQQLRGGGCTFDAECNSHWSWSRYLTTRQPQIRCVTDAAMCLTLAFEEKEKVLNELYDVARRKEDYYNTGDGVIGNGSCLKEAISSIEGKETKDSYLSTCRR